MFNFGILLVASCVYAATVACNNVKRPATQSSCNTCVCPYEYKPVCGNDRITYPSQCYLACQIAKNPTLKKHHDGPCHEDQVPQQTPEIDTCSCSKDLKSVCGTDGITYPSQCYLACEIAKNPALRKHHDGPCHEDQVPQQTPEIDTCSCSKDLKSVCGTDGITYRSHCYLACEIAKNPALRKHHDGPCHEDQVPQKTPEIDTCSCSKDLKSVCGTDGITYRSQCYLACEITKNPALRKHHDGPCHEDQVPQQTPEIDTCSCSKDLKSVCGTDGITYPSQCYLACEIAKNPALRKHHDGPCHEDQVPQQIDTCSCSKDLKSVCGTDGITYPSQCYLACEIAKNPALRKHHDGPCHEDQVFQQVEIDTCLCSKDLKPVCGTDGITYNNICLLNCAAKVKPVEKKYDGACHAGVKTKH